MTRLTVLCLALVISIFDTASEPADHGNNQTINKMKMVVNNITMNRTKTIDNLDVYNENIREITSVSKRHVSIGVGNRMRQYDVKVRQKRAIAYNKCEMFEFITGRTEYIMHPREEGNKETYSNNTTCITTIRAPDDKHVIHLTFIDIFHIEDHPNCEYDFLEIRDGEHGYADRPKRVCGKSFPAKISSSGPYLWLKFKSDENIEYEGFKIRIEFVQSQTSQTVDPSCYINLPEQSYGEIDSNSTEYQECRTRSPNSLDILWRIQTPPGTRIYLDFKHYGLQKPNECESNLVQVFGAETNFDHKLDIFCGSVANAVTTKAEKANDFRGNIMHIRLFAARVAREKSSIIAIFTSFRTLEGEDTCDEDTEFDCADSTCIDAGLKCNEVPNCRLKTDEDKETCKGEKESLLKQHNILVILVIFTLILSGMSFVFLFKCFRKLYQDHKLIKEHIKQSCEDRLDTLIDTQLTLDAKRLERDSEPRPSLERENQTNEMYKQQRSKRKASSIDSDFLPETHLDLEDDAWRREAESIPVDAEDIRIEHKGRNRRSDTSKREESLRSKSIKEQEKDKKEIRDASVGAPDTKESGCQTRESLFQADTAPSSDGSGTNSRGFSTFGYSGATIVRPSPAPANTSEITIELLRQVTPQESIKSQKKMDRRPMSSETTRSAPDVIIVSKPIR